MTLFKYDPTTQDPFSGIDSLLEQFGRGFRNTFSDAVGSRQMPVNLYANEDEYEVRAELPGVRKSDVSVEIENAVLEIKATRESSEDDAKSQISFVRRITVGDDVDTEKVKAKLQDGILSVHLPKREARKPKAIKVS